MKRIITYISILAAVLTAGVSCTREAIGENAENGVITLRIKTEDMSTRVTVNENAGTELGKGAENAILYVDYFFFADTDQNTPAIKSGHLSVDDLTKVSDTEYTYRFDTTQSEYEMLKGKSYLYVVANYPGTIQETTLGGLLSMPISTNFTEAQTSFVMDSYDNGDTSGLISLIPAQKDEVKTVVVKLARCAAKLVLRVDVKNSYTDEANNLWTPVTSQMWVNFVNARNRTTLDAEAVAFDDKAFYYSTESKAPTRITDKAGYTSWQVDPVYTYPQLFTVSDVTAPYFKIFCPWVCDGKGTNNFYYKILLPQLGSFQRNKIYKMTVDLSVIGSTEDDWALASEYICVVDWWKPEDVETSFEGAMYLDIPVRYYEIYGVNDVYIPVISSNNIRITNLKGSKINLYNGNTVSVTATTSDESKEGFRLNHTLNTDMTSANFDCTPITYTMTVQHTQGGLSKTVNVTVVQYPSIYAEADASNGYAFVNSYAGTNGRGRYTTANYAYGTGTNYGPVAYNNNNQQLSSMASSIGSGSGTANNNGNQYVVHVSVLPEGYRVAGMTDDVIIGDPRGGRLSANYLGYAAGNNGGRVNTVQTNYDAVATNTQNVIAPAIRIASSWGATGTLASYDRAEERCASYQENGYPAGRWRVPTVAEIDFLIRLSENNHIPELFTCGVSGNGYNRYYLGYWANGPAAYAGSSFTSATGRPYQTGSGSGSPIVTINGYRFDNVVRCVYDEWYWSDTKYNNAGQPINGTGTAATQWLGYIY